MVLMLKPIMLAGETIDPFNDHIGGIYRGPGSEAFRAKLDQESDGKGNLAMYLSHDQRRR
jgi:hypothetical protein